MPTNTVDIRPLNVALGEPFIYNGEQLDELNYARVIIVADGVMGEGEVGCGPDTTGQTQASSIEMMKWIKPKLVERLQQTPIESMVDVIGVMNRVNPLIPHNSALKRGIEQGLVDIVAQNMRLPVAKVLAGESNPFFKESVKVQCTIPFQDSAAAYNRKLAILLEQNAEFIKFKVGPENLELASAAASRLKAERPSVNISVDANQTFYTVMEATEFVKKFEKGVLSWIEQPFARDHHSGLVRLKEAFPKLQIMIDEGVHSVADVEKLCRLRTHDGKRVVDIINIKPDKHGGFFPSFDIMDAAREVDPGVKFILGSMLHSPLGLKYMLAGALSGGFLTHDFGGGYFSLKERPNPELIDPKTLMTTSAVLDEFAQHFSPRSGLTLR